MLHFPHVITVIWRKFSFLAKLCMSSTWPTLAVPWGWRTHCPVLGLHQLRYLPFPLSPGLRPSGINTSTDYLKLESAMNRTKVLHVPRGPHSTFPSMMPIPWAWKFDLGHIFIPMLTPKISTFFGLSIIEKQSHIHTKKETTWNASRQSWKTFTFQSLSCM